MTAPKKKRGRPSLPAGEGKRVPLNMRTTRELRSKVEEAARQSGRSLVQEVERRLEQSFRDKEAQYETFGDEETYRLMLALASVKRVYEEQEDAGWRDNPEVFSGFKVMISAILDSMGPGTPDRPGGAFGHLAPVPSEMRALDLVAELRRLVARDSKEEEQIDQEAGVCPGNFRS